MSAIAAPVLRDNKTNDSLAAVPLPMPFPGKPRRAPYRSSTLKNMDVNSPDVTDRDIELVVIQDFTLEPLALGAPRGRGRGRVSESVGGPGRGRGRGRGSVCERVGGRSRGRGNVRERAGGRGRGRGKVRERSEGAAEGAARSSSNSSSSTSSSTSSTSSSPTWSQRTGGPRCERPGAKALSSGPPSAPGPKIRRRGTSSGGQAHIYLRDCLL